MRIEEILRPEADTVGGCRADPAGQGLEGSANVDDECVGDWWRGDPIAGFVLDFEAVVRCGLQQECEKPGVFVGAYPLKADFIGTVAGRWWVFDELQFMLLRIIKSLVQRRGREV